MTRIERQMIHCRTGDSDACHDVAVAFERGREVPMDLSRAFDYYSEACSLGDDQACDAVRLHVPPLRRVHATEDRPLEVADAAPEPGEPALKGDAFYYGSGEWGKDLAVARNVYERECALGRAEACVKAGIMQAKGEGGEPALGDAHESLELACELDHSRCMDIALMYRHDELGGFLRDRSDWFRKRALHSEGELGCRYGAAERCVVYAQGFLAGKWVDHDPEYAFVLLREACHDGDLRGCTELANLYVAGTGTAVNGARALELYRRACDGGVGTACWKLGKLYLHGTHVEQDPTEAERLFALSCRYGYQAGCDYVDKRPR